MRTLYHASAHDWGNLTAGDVVILKPGTQNAQGVGVYFSAGLPDIRASDSVHEKGLQALFRVAISGESALRRNWYVSKGGRDRKKGRPQTWHSSGKHVRLTITEVDGRNISATGELLN